MRKKANGTEWGQEDPPGASGRRVLGDVQPNPMGIYNQCQWELNTKKPNIVSPGIRGAAGKFIPKAKPKEGVGAESCKGDIYRVWEDLQRYLLNAGDAV